MKRIHLCFGLLAALVANQAYGQGNNNPPPAGAILDLDGTPITHTAYTEYTVNFVASAAVTTLTIAMREDPAFIYLDNVTMNNLTHPLGNQVVNGSFETAPYGVSNPTGWSYQNQHMATFSGLTDGYSSPLGAEDGSHYWGDGSVQAYDAISQDIATMVGDTYHISLYMYDNSGLSNYSLLSTNGDTMDTGGNGADLLVYAGSAIQLMVPVPPSAVLMGLGCFGFVGSAWRNRRKAAL